MIKNSEVVEKKRKSPTLFAWLASGVAVLVIVLAQILPRGSNQYFRVFGVLILLVAAIFIFVPFYLLSMYGETTDENTYMQSGQVVDKGLYAITRHPQYLGYILLVGGFALLSQHWAVFLLAFISMVCYFIQSLKEELYCLSQFGEPYAKYLQRVSRFNLILNIFNSWKE